MRYPAEQKQETHDRIVEAASRRFRRHGENNVAIADLMQELKMTHGGFYKHFNSKQDLFIESIEKAFEEAADRFERVAKKARPGTELQAVIETYLNLEHSANMDECCPVAAFGPEMIRQPRAVRMRFDAAIRNHAQRFAKFLPGSTDAVKRRNFGILFSGLSGALNLARAISDEDMKKKILDGAREFYIRSFCR